MIKLTITIQTANGQTRGGVINESAQALPAEVAFLQRLDWELHIRHLIEDLRNRLKDEPLVP